MHNMTRPFAVGAVEEPPEGCPIQRDAVLTQVGEGLHPGGKGLLQTTRLSQGEHAPKRIVGGKPMGEVEECREPSRLSMPPMGYFSPILGATKSREDGDGANRLQGGPRGGVLTTWVIDNRKKSQNLLDPRGVGHSAILRRQAGAQCACSGREHAIIHRQHTNWLMRLPWKVPLTVLASPSVY